MASHCIADLESATIVFGIPKSGHHTFPTDYLTFMRVCGYQRIGLTRYLPIYCIVLDCEIGNIIIARRACSDACVRIHFTTMTSAKIMSII